MIEDRAAVGREALAEELGGTISFRPTHPRRRPAGRFARTARASRTPDDRALDEIAYGGA